jgi:hypothetical protein
MSRKLTLSLLLVMLGLAGFDALVNMDAAAPTRDDVRATHDGAGSYPPN